MEAPPGFEPGNKGFADLGLTTWQWHRTYMSRHKATFLQKALKKSASWFYGAEDEIRTRDVHLGKVTLYHWATPAYYIFLKS